MWTKPALARALRQQTVAHRRRNFTFTPAPLPREMERSAQEPAHKAEAPARQPSHTEVVLSD
jgi:hypothetical protein